MAPLLVLVAVTGAVYAISAARASTTRGHWTTALRGGLAAMFALTGTTHFVGLREDLIAIVPPALPAPDLLVTVTGVLELAGAVGLLWRPTAAWSAAGLAGLLIAVFPANVHAALSGNGLGGAPPTPLGLRTALQVLFLASAVAVYVSLRREQEHRCAWREVLTSALPPAHGPAHPSAPGAVMVSRLQLRSVRDVAGFLRAALHLRRAFRASPGGITLRVAASPLTGTFWTWSSWADEHRLQDYARSQLHVRIMRHYRSRVGDSTFRILDPSQDALPTTWVEVRTLTAPVRPAHGPELTRR